MFPEGGIVLIKISFHFYIVICEQCFPLFISRLIPVESHQLNLLVAAW